MFSAESFLVTILVVAVVVLFASPMMVDVVNVVKDFQDVVATSHQ